MSRPRSPFSVFKKKSSAKSKPFYYARFRDESGDYGGSVSTGETNRDKAVLWANNRLKENLKSGDPILLDFLNDFWKLGGQYSKEKALTGHPLSLEYIKGNQDLVRLHVLPFPKLAKTKVSKLSPGLVKWWLVELSENGRNPGTINKAWKAVRVAVNAWALDNRQTSPVLGVKSVHEEPKAREILSRREIGDLLALDHQDFDPRGYAGVLLGVLCGLRMGEVRGLQKSDIHEAEGMLQIVHNYVVDAEGLKAPKWDSKGSVPAPVEVFESLKRCMDLAPFDTEYVFFNSRSFDRPCREHLISDSWKTMLRALGIDPAQRNLPFHSTRHCFVSLCRSVLPADVARGLARHKTEEMNSHYGHAEIIDFAEASLMLRKNLDGLKDRRGVV